MNPSRFRHRIELLERKITKDNLMQEVKTYESWSKLWADVKTTKGSDYVNAAQEQQKIITRFIVRYSKTLDQFIREQKTSFQVIFKDVTYEVTDVINDDEMNKTFTILAEGRV